MAKSKNTKAAKARAAAPLGAYGSAMSATAVAQREAHRRSGAAGAHSDSNIRSASHTSGRTNRVGSRSSARHAAVRDYA